MTDTVFARARSGHHVIVSPWEGMSFIGPTDTAVDDTPDTVCADAIDVDLVLDTVNDTIAAGVPLTHDDIQATTVGIRPLIVRRVGGLLHAPAAATSCTTTRPPGCANLWSIGGGKWTTGAGSAPRTCSTLLRSPGAGRRDRRDFELASRRRVTARSRGPAMPGRTSTAPCARRPEGPADDVGCTWPACTAPSTST